MPNATQRVIEHFQHIVKPDGGELELLGEADGVVRLRYLPGHNQECETCVLSADDLKELMTEAIQQQDPAIRAVELVLDRAAK